MAETKSQAKSFPKKGRPTGSRPFQEKSAGHANRNLLTSEKRKYFPTKIKKLIFCTEARRLPLLSAQPHPALPPPPCLFNSAPVDSAFFSSAFFSRHDESECGLVAQTRPLPLARQVLEIQRSSGLKLRSSEERGGCWQSEFARTGRLRPFDLGARCLFVAHEQD